MRQVVSSAEAPESDGVEPLQKLYWRVCELRDEVARWDRQLRPWIDSLPVAARESARNLVHYLAMRRTELRPLQEELAEHGLSSLGRAESHVLANLEAVLGILGRLTPQSGRNDRVPDLPVLSREAGRALLETRANGLFGTAPEYRSVRVMVTVPDEAATNYLLVRDLVASGMDCMRINCAHGDQSLWRAMIENLRRAEKEVGRHCQILMDLAGPRARTGAIEPGPGVIKIRPKRDALGSVVKPAEVWLTAADAPVGAPLPAEAVIPLAGSLLREIHTGDRLRFRDARGSKRAFQVVGEAEGGFWARLGDTAYVTSGTVVRHIRPGDGGESPRKRSRIGRIAPIDQWIPLEVHDGLVLTRDQRPGTPAALDSEGRAVAPARIPCVPPEILADLLPGEPIWFDEGKIGGIVESVTPEEVVVSITATASEGSRLGGGKAINLPETRLRLSSLTDQDLAHLPFIVEHADLVGYSFVRSATDVAQLYGQLDALGGERLGVVLKIETAQAFEEFPSIVLAALRRDRVGAMIARGDLAVECGFARLAELQEELLWLCEAAHLPVIWATQVLERLAKHGRPSRAEVTDAAVAVRAECVMLNKGPHIIEAVRALDSILIRMQAHLEKKQSLLKPLAVAERFLSGTLDGQPPQDRTTRTPGGRSGVAERSRSARSALGDEDRGSTNPAVT